jgi:hypothetical protein
MPPHAVAFATPITPQPTMPPHAVA